MLRCRVSVESLPIPQRGDTTCGEVKFSLQVVSRHSQDALRGYLKDGGPLLEPIAVPRSMPHELRLEDLEQPSQKSKSVLSQLHSLLQSLAASLSSNSAGARSSADLSAKGAADELIAQSPIRGFSWHPFLFKLCANLVCSRRNLTMFCQQRCLRRR